MWETCRYCGSTSGRGLVVQAGRDDLCPRCAASPLCAACAHPRESHTAVFIGGAAGCAHRWHDHQSLAKVSCDCPGFQPIVGAIGDAAFAQPDDGPFDFRLGELDALEP
jgi:hypothetical protein